jgi:hypothetical protein
VAFQTCAPAAVVCRSSTPTVIAKLAWSIDGRTTRSHPSLRIQLAAAKPTKTPKAYLQALRKRGLTGAAMIRASESTPTKELQLLHQRLDLPHLPAWLAAGVRRLLLYQTLIRSFPSHKKRRRSFPFDPRATMQACILTLCLLAYCTSVLDSSKGGGRLPRVLPAAKDPTENLRPLVLGRERPQVCDRMVSRIQHLACKKSATCLATLQPDSPTYWRARLSDAC